MKCMYEVNEMGAALLKINYPPLNAIDDQVLEELESAVESNASDNRVKVAIVTGDGAALVAGADIKKMQKVNTTTQAEEITLKAHAVLSRIENSRKPYIAAINGLCLVGGTELALACHMRIADDGVTMGLPRDLFRDHPWIRRDAAECATTGACAGPRNHARQEVHRYD
jgi:enoyl-CoA hydratase/carnithine racemase